jgi:hypothetical protein
VVPPGADLVPAAVSAISRLRDSYLLVQGPPGAGKTYSSARAIVELIAAGRRVGVASNSHKAINNLLTEVEKVALERGVRFSGVKKSSREDQFLTAQVSSSTPPTTRGVLPSHRLVAGVAWLFARPELDLAFDHLFVDEAGQVSLANIVAMGVSARNILLVGDQMQLSQPIQGTHPGGSGVSGLDHLLAGHATVSAGLRHLPPRHAPHASRPLPVRLRRRLRRTPRGRRGRSGSAPSRRLHGRSRGAGAGRPPLRPRRACRLRAAIGGGGCQTCVCLRAAARLRMDRPGRPAAAMTVKDILVVSPTTCRWTCSGVR